MGSVFAIPRRLTRKRIPRQVNRTQKNNKFKPEFTTLEARHRLALTEGQKENKGKKEERG